MTACSRDIFCGLYCRQHKRLYGCDSGSYPYGSKQCKNTALRGAVLQALFLSHVPLLHRPLRERKTVSDDRQDSGRKDLFS